MGPSSSTASPTVRWLASGYRNFPEGTRAGSSLRSSVALSSSPLRPKRNPGLAGVMDGDRTRLPYVRLMKGEWAMPLRVIFTTLFVIALATFAGPVASADSGTQRFGYLIGTGFLCGLDPSGCP